MENLKRDSVSHSIYIEDRKFINETWTQLNKWVEESKKNCYDSDNVAQKQRKRSAAFLLPIIGLLASGFSLYENYRLSQHVKRLSNQFEDFRSDQRRFNELQIKYNGEILHLYKSLEDELTLAKFNWDCQTNNLGYQILHSRKLIMRKSYLETIYKDIIQGSFTGSIPATTFPKETVQAILNETTMLKGTIYHHNPKLFFKLGKMYIADQTVSDLYFNIHIVLSIPIQNEAKLWPLYSIQQVGVFSGGECSKFNVPNLVFVRN